VRAVVIRHPGKGLEAWKMADLPDQTPGPAQVLIRVRAASLNYRDLLIARNLYGPTPRQNLIPVSDGAGEVIGWAWA
jgi:NADPH:quinone reductase-like Zn-dependent oxidoreductase